jgi:hypothetical protein
MAQTVQARSDILQATRETAEHIWSLYRYEPECPPDLEPRVYDVAQEFLLRITDPSFARNIGHTVDLLRDYAHPILQELVDQTPESLGEGSGSVTPEEAVETQPPEAPPAKRSRGMAASTGRARSPSPLFTPPLPPSTAPAALASGSSISTGSGRVTRSISRGSHSSRGSLRPAASGSRAGPGEDGRKRKRAADKWYVLFPFIFSILH